jgi:hypothetical protein
MAHMDAYDMMDTKKSTQRRLWCLQTLAGGEQLFQALEHKYCCSGQLQTEASRHRPWQ